MAPASAGATWETRDLGGTTTHVYTPASQSSIGDGRALMVVLHGCSQTSATLRDNGNFEHTAETFGMVIAVPSVPAGGVLAGCWNYYDGTADAETDAVIAIADELQLDGALGIDPAQTYLAGFSSGGGEAQVIACAAPERFAGVAVVAGPSLGTTAFDVFAVPAGLDASTLAERCNALAGPMAAALGTHLAITMSDSADFSVAQGYAALDAEMFAALYTEQGAVLSSSLEDLASAEGSNPSGIAYVESDAQGPRIARLSTMGLGHNWPAGSGLDPSAFTFVTGDGIDFAAYAARFFTDNNRRVIEEGDDTGTGDSGGSSDGGVDATSGGGTGGESGVDGTGSETGMGSASTGRPDGSDSSDTGDTGGETGTGAVDDPASGCQCAALGSRPDGSPHRGTAWLGMGLLLLRRGATRRRRK